MIMNLWILSVPLDEPMLLQPGVVMLDGLDHVKDGANKLVGIGEIRDRLRAAHAELAVSLIQKDQWPDDLLPEAQRLAEDIREYLDTGGDDATASRLAEAYLNLAFGVNAAYRDHAGE